jgi:hypothetical protein
VSGTWTLAVAIVFASACSDEPSRDAERKDTLDARALASLNMAERNTVCDVLIDQLDGAFTEPQFERLACTRQAVPISFQVDQSGRLGGNVELCQQLVGDCVQNGGALGEDPPAKNLSEDLVNADSCRSGEQFEACDLTVREFKDCAETFAANVQERLALASCAALSDREQIEEAFGPDVDPTMLPECAAFMSECPNLRFDPNVDGHKRL